MPDNIIQLNRQVIKTELKDLVKQSIEKTINVRVSLAHSRTVKVHR